MSKVTIAVDSKDLKTCQRCGKTYFAKRLDSTNCGCRRPLPEELKERNCEYCGIEFEPKLRKSRYCSRKCSKRSECKRNAERYNENAKKYYRDNIEQMRKKRKAYYWKDPEKWRKQTREYWSTRREEKRSKDNDYKDNIRHGGKRKELLENGLLCANCGTEKPSNRLDAHHITHNPAEHEHQELLCKSCHAKEHHNN